MFRKKILISQPQQITRANLGTTLSNSLISLVSPSFAYDVIRNKLVTLAGNATLVSSLHGKAWKGATANSPIDLGATGGINSLVDVYKPWSWASRIYINTLSINGVILADFNSSASNLHIQFYQSTSNTWIVTGVNNSSLSVGSVTVGWHDVLLTSSGGTAYVLRLYIDGLLIGTSATSTGAMTGQTGTQLRLMNPGTYVSSAAFPGMMTYSAFFNTDVSAYVKSLANNPWQLFKAPASQIILTSVASNTDFTGSAQVLANATGQINSSLSLSGANISIATTTGAIASQNILSGSNISAFTGTGSLTASISLAGASASASIENGTVSLAMTLSGASVASAIATAQATMLQSLSGSAGDQATATGNLLSTDSGFSGNAVSSTSGVGSITITVALSGASINTVLASAGINSVIPLTGNAQGTSSGIADLISIDSGALVGTAQSIVSINGQLGISIPLTGSAIGIATGTGDASSVIPLTGTNSSVSAATGDLLVQFIVAGDAIAQVISTGSLSVMVGLAGATVARTLASAGLYVDTMINAALQHRIYTILAENRLYTVSAENRLFTIPRY